MRVFLDANVLFSAAKSPGAIRKLLGLVLDAGHELWVDPFVIAEARRNLEVKAPGSLSSLDSVIARTNVGELRSDPSLEASLPLPDKDRPVLAAAIHNRCHALMTGDRTHFGRLYGRTFHDVTIHSPRSLAEALLPGSRRTDHRT